MFYGLWIEGVTGQTPKYDRSKPLDTQSRSPTEEDMSVLSDIFHQLSCRQINPRDKVVIVESTPASSLRGFLDLPGEIRNLIYKFLLIQNDSIAVFWLTGRGFLEPPLLRTHPLIRAEATPIFYASNSFVTDNSLELLPWLRQIGPKRRILVNRGYLIHWKRPTFPIPKVAQRLVGIRFDHQHRVQGASIPKGFTDPKGIKYYGPRCRAWMNAAVGVDEWSKTKRKEGVVIDLSDVALYATWRHTKE